MSDNFITFYHYYTVALSSVMMNEACLASSHVRHTGLGCPHTRGLWVARVSPEVMVAELGEVWGGWGKN